MAKRAVHDVLSHLACYQNTFFSFHTSLRAVSAAPFSCILGCASKPVKSKKSLDLTHPGADWENPKDTPRLFLSENDSSSKQIGDAAAAVMGKTLLLSTYKYLIVDDNVAKIRKF